MEIEINRWGTNGVHDPTVIKDMSCDSYYMFSTDTVMNHLYTPGIQIRKSSNLVSWEYMGTALDGVPQEAGDWSGAKGLWAPEVIKTDQGYRMYYSASTFGSTRSCIGLAEAKELEGPWYNRGIVVKTSKEFALHNAIDANVVRDQEGMDWLCYGSFFGGIHLLALDKETGLAKTPNDLGNRIAKRSQTVEGAIEGPFIYFNKKTNYYYLFSSYDSLAGTYNIRVSRSQNIQGPYLDMNEKGINDDTDENAQNGVKIAGSFQFSGDIPWLAPGHNSIFEENEKSYIVHHIRVEGDKKNCYGMIREMFWLSSGWPVLSPEYIHFDNQEEDVSASDLVGEWEYITLDTQTDVKQAQKMDSEEHDFRLIEKNEFIMTTKSIQMNVFVGYDWSKRKKRLMFTGLNEKGFACFGKKLEVIK